jgi:regulator of replication initiation timing
MDYIGYAGIFAAGAFIGALAAAMRLSTSYKKLEEYANHLRAVLTATEQRYKELSSDNSRLRIKNHALQRTIEEQEENAQYRAKIQQA